MGHTFEIEVADREFVRDALTAEERGVLAVALADYVSAADAIVTAPGGPVVVTSISPPRARYPENVTITGSGFSGRAGQNEVNIGGFFAAIVSESTTQLVVQMPFFLSVVDDYLSEVSVENLTHGTVGYGWLWVKDSTLNVAAHEPAENAPGEDEESEDDRPDYCEAQDIERLLTLIEFVMRDTTVDAGDVVSRDDAGLAGVTGGKTGQVLVVDPTADPGLAWKWEVDMTLPYGRAIVANPGAAVMLVANGHQDSVSSSTNTRSYAPMTCKVDLLWLLCKTAGATDTISRIRLIENGSLVLYDSGAVLSLGNNGVHRVVLDVTTTAGRDLEFEVTKTGTTDTFKVVGGVRLRL